MKFVNFSKENFLTIVLLVISHHEFGDNLLAYRLFWDICQ